MCGEPRPVRVTKPGDRRPVTGHRVSSHPRTHKLTLELNLTTSCHAMDHGRHKLPLNAIPPVGPRVQTPVVDPRGSRKGLRQRAQPPPPSSIPSGGTRNRLSTGRVEGANNHELIPKLNVLVGEQLRRRAAIEARLEALSKVIGQVPETVSVDPSDPPRIRDMKEELGDRIAEYQRGWKSLESLGGTVKDARVGLVDFYGQIDGKLVWLCWRYGEGEITHYHALDEGFSARREIRSSTKMRLIN